MPRERASEVDRRDFLKSAAAGATAFVAADATSAEPQQSSSSAALASGDRRHRENEGTDRTRHAHAGQRRHRRLLRACQHAHSRHRPRAGRPFRREPRRAHTARTWSWSISIPSSSKATASVPTKPKFTPAFTARDADVMSIVHTHPVYSVVFSITKKPILPVHMHGAIFADGVPGIR